MFERKKNSMGATLIVSAGSLGVSLFVMKNETEITSEYTKHAELALQSRSIEQTANSLKQLIIENGESLIRSYQQTSGHHVGKVLLLLQAPLVESFTVQSTKTFQVPTKITDAVLDLVARDALGNLNQKDTFLSVTMLRVNLNGYVTSRAEGKYATTVELTGLVTIMEHSLHEIFLSAFQTILPHSQIVMRSDALALTQVAKTLGDSRAENSLIVFLSGDVTEFVAMHEGIPTTCGYVPVGVRHIAELAFPNRSAQTSFEDLRLSVRGKQTDEGISSSESSLISIESDLARKYGESLSKISSVQRLPPSILLIAPDELSDWFARFLERIDFAPFTMTSKPFLVSLTPHPPGDATLGEIGTILSLAVPLIKQGF